MFSSKTEPENTWVRVMGTSCADGSAGLMRPGGRLSPSSAGGRRPARGAQAARLAHGVAPAGQPERLLPRLVRAELHSDPQPVQHTHDAAPGHPHDGQVLPPRPPPPAPT